MKAHPRTIIDIVVDVTFSKKQTPLFSGSGDCRSRIKADFGHPFDDVSGICRHDSGNVLLKHLPNDDDGDDYLSSLRTFELTSNKNESYEYLENDGTAWVWTGMAIRKDADMTMTASHIILESSFCHLCAEVKARLKHYIVRTRTIDKKHDDDIIVFLGSYRKFSYSGSANFSKYLLARKDVNDDAKNYRDDARDYHSSRRRHHLPSTAKDISSKNDDAYYLRSIEYDEENECRMPSRNSESKVGLGQKVNEIKRKNTNSDTNMLLPVLYQQSRAESSIFSSSSSSTTTTDSFRNFTLSPSFFFIHPNLQRVVTSACTEQTNSTSLTWKKREFIRQKIISWLEDER